MVERHISKQGLAVLYQLVETPGAIPRPEMADFLAVTRLCAAMKGAIGEYPKGKGPEVPVMTHDGPGAKQATNKDGSPMLQKLWKVDYPKSAMVVLRLEEAADLDVLVGVWDRHDKSRFFADEEMREWAVTLDAQLKGKAVPGQENREQRRRKKG